MTLSILLPTFNGTRFLEEQLLSIREQTVTDWRLWVCDDGSTDGTAALLRTQADADPRITVLPASGPAPNLGQRRRLRQLADANTAPLLAIADQDDVWAPDKLERLLAGLGDRDLCFGSSWLIDAAGRPFGRDLAASIGPAYRSGDRLSYLFRPLVSAHALLARRHLLNAPALSRALPFDWLMTLEAAFGRGLAYVPEARTLHRIHGDNQSNAVLVHPPGWPRALSRSAVLRARRDVAGARLLFVGLLEHLAFAEAIAEERRAPLRAARDLCLGAWFAQGPAPAGGADALLARLVELLAPLAGSEGDLGYARTCLAGLCAHPGGLGWLRARAARLRLERDPVPPLHSDGAGPM
jgi:glycosyltransferase involved in cell wall biosynthesis